MTPFNLILLIFCCFLLLLLFLLWPAKRKPEKTNPFYGRNFAHRGLHTKDETVPENSLAAFRAAVEAGYGIELDIQLSRDGQVVVFHDDDLKRVCGVDARVDSLTYEELRALRLLGTEEHIPLFEEMLALVDGKAPLIVELKRGPHNTQLCEKAWEILQGYTGEYCIESFDPRIVRWFKKNAKEVVRGQLAAAPKTLGGGVQGFIVGTLLCNFLGRPHFIAYGLGAKPLTVPFAESAALRVAWTVRPGDDVSNIQAENDALIFEFYTPPPRYKRPEDSAENAESENTETSDDPAENEDAEE